MHICTTHKHTCIHAIYSEMSHNIQYTNNIDNPNYIKNISTTKSYMKYILTAVGIYCGPGLIFYSHFKVFVKSHGEELNKSGQRESFFYHFQLSRIRKLFPMQSKQWRLQSDQSRNTNGMKTTVEQNCYEIWKHKCKTFIFDI